MSDFNVTCHPKQHETVVATLRKQGWFGRGFVFYSDNHPGVALHVKWKMR